jgi:hypothetical protein
VIRSPAISTVIWQSSIPIYVEHHEGDANAKLIVLVGVEGEDAKRLERISEARGKNAADVVAELLRDADRSLA